MTSLKEFRSEKTTSEKVGSENVNQKCSFWSKDYKKLRVKKQHRGRDIKEFITVNKGIKFDTRKDRGVNSKGEYFLSLAFLVSLQPEVKKEIIAFVGDYNKEIAVLQAKATKRLTSSK